jgi:hypothetical protein
MTTAQPTPAPAPTAVPMGTPREGYDVDVAELLVVYVGETVVGAAGDAVWPITVVDMIDGVPAYVVRSVAGPLIVPYPSVSQCPPR